MDTEKVERMLDQILDETKQIHQLLDEIDQIHQLLLERVPSRDIVNDLTAFQPEELRKVREAAWKKITREL